MTVTIRDHGVWQTESNPAALTDAQLQATRAALDIEVARRAVRAKVDAALAESEARSAEANEARQKFAAVIEAARNERGKFFLAFREAALSLGRCAQLAQQAAELVNKINAAQVAPDPVLLREAAEAGIAPNPLPALLDEFKQTDGFGWDWQLSIPMPVLIPNDRRTNETH